MHQELNSLKGIEINQSFVLYCFFYIAFFNFRSISFFLGFFFYCICTSFSCFGWCAESMDTFVLYKCIFVWKEKKEIISIVFQTSLSFSLFDSFSLVHSSLSLSLTFLLRNTDSHTHSLTRSLYQTINQSINKSINLLLAIFRSAITISLLFPFVYEQRYFLVKVLKETNGKRL